MTPRLQLVAVALLAGLFAWTTLVRTSGADERAARHFDRATVERGMRHAFERRCMFWADTAAQLVLLAAAVRWGRWLADGCERACRGRRLPAILLLGAGFFVCAALVDLPFAAARGWAHPRAWGLTDRSFSSWLVDHGKGLALAAAMGAVALAVLHLLQRRFPRRWWIPAAAGATALSCLMSLVYPIWIAPLFNDFTPLTRTEHAALEPRVRALAERAGVPFDEIVVMDASRQGRHTNAFFAGIGGTRTVVLYDTLLMSHTPDEVESILAHEFGHWRRDHVLKGTLLTAAGVFLVFFLAALVLTRAVGRPPLLLRDAADPAALPLLLLVLWVASWAATPVESAVSRRFEREADRDSIELTGNPDVFVEAQKHLVRDNILDVAPPPGWVWMFASHPTPVERIEAALAARPR